MVNAAKQNTGAFTDTILNKYGARSTDEDRLYALITSNTMQSRLRLLWPGVDDQRKKPYVDKGVAGMTDAKQLGKLMNHPESFAKGKNLDSFLADVQKNMFQPESDVDPGEVVGHIKKAMAEIPETEKEKELFRSAALETCKGLKEGLSQTATDSDGGREFLKYTEQLQTEMTAAAMIKGGTALAEVYQKSANAVKAAGKEQDAAELDPQLLVPKKNDLGLSSPVR